MAKKAKKKTLDLTLPIFQLKISLEHISPPIWRRVQTSDCTLEDLHQIIQMVMDWDDMHMHAFAINGEQYGNFRRGGEFDYDSRFVWISEVVEERQSQFHYDYDFGDNWRHVIEVEKTLPAEEGIRYPRCVDGAAPARPRILAVPTTTPSFLRNSRTPTTKSMRMPWSGLARASIPRRSILTKRTRDFFTLADGLAGERQECLRRDLR